MNQTSTTTYLYLTCKLYSVGTTVNDLNQHAQHTSGPQVPKTPWKSMHINIVWVFWYIRRGKRSPGQHVESLNINSQRVPQDTLILTFHFPWAGPSDIHYFDIQWYKFGCQIGHSAHPLTHARLVLRVNLVLILVPEGNECSQLRRNRPLRGWANIAGGIGPPSLGKQGEKIPSQAQLASILKLSAHHFLSNILLWSVDHINFLMLF